MCHAYRYDDRARRLMEDEFERSDVRASDAERERVVEALRGDLPSERRAYPRRSPQSHRAPAPSFMPIVLVLIAIWAITGAGYFWPIWPLVWFGFFAFARAGSHIRVTSHTRRTW